MTAIFPAFVVNFFWPLRGLFEAACRMHWIAQYPGGIRDRVA
jgi:hypothetical protein